MAQIWVESYVKKDGARVPGHYRKVSSRGIYLNWKIEGRRKFSRRMALEPLKVKRVGDQVLIPEHFTLYGNPVKKKRGIVTDIPIAGTYTIRTGKKEAYYQDHDIERYSKRREARVAALNKRLWKKAYR